MHIKESTGKSINTDAYQAEANVEDDVALVPELRDGAESEDADPELETAVLVKEFAELEGAVEPARGADTLFAEALLGSARGCEESCPVCGAGRGWGCIIGGYCICDISKPPIPGAGLNLAVAGEMRTDEQYELSCQK